jgi:hypothetical protein
VILNNFGHNVLSKINIRKRSVQIIAGLIILLLIGLAVFAFSGDDNDVGDGFTKTTTPVTKTTKPSSDPTIKQPCSLLTKNEASALLGQDVKDGVNADIDDNTLRCRFDGISSDAKYFFNVNVYVLKTQKAYDVLKVANNGIKIETNVDDGFYAERSKTQETERVIAIISGEKRVAISVSMALVIAGGLLTQEELTLPDASELALYAGNIMAKINS